MRQYSRAVRSFRFLTGAVCALGLMLGAAGCESDAQTGGLIGAGIGALAGQAIGGDTESTVIGTAAGAGIGYVIGNESDKQKARRYNPQQPSSYEHELAPLAGTRWRVTSIVPSNSNHDWASKIVDFRHDGRVITTTTMRNGEVLEDNERYRVVGRTLIINKPGYLVNARFHIDGNQLIMDAEDFSMVMSRMRS